MKTVIEMAREAELIAQEGYQGTGWFWGHDNLERFAELVRADAIADERVKLAEQPAQQEPVGCEGAIVNGRVYADRLEHDYKFECEAGPLHLCTDWVEFRRCFEWLAQHTSPPAQRKPLTDEEIDRLWVPHTIIQATDRRQQAFARAIEAAHGIKE